MIFCPNMKTIAKNGQSSHVKKGLNLDKVYKDMQQQTCHNNLSSVENDILNCSLLKDMFQSYASRLLRSISSTYDIPLNELSSYYNIEDIEDITQEQIDSLEKSKHEEHILMHTHLPVRWLVPGCSYCQQHGNILVESVH